MALNDANNRLLDLTKDTVKQPSTPYTNLGGIKSQGFNESSISNVTRFLLDSVSPEVSGRSNGITSRNVNFDPTDTSSNVSQRSSSWGDQGEDPLVPYQFSGYEGLSDSEVASICGPVAAIGFARYTGRSPTVQEAVELARDVGWDQETGMYGVQAEHKLLQEMGVPARLEWGRNWDTIRQQTGELGQPVIISTPRHYFFIKGYDPQSGKYYVGNSGRALRGGSNWMTADEIEASSGTVDGTLFIGSD